MMGAIYQPHTGTGDYFSLSGLSDTADSRIKGLESILYGKVQQRRDAIFLCGVLEVKCLSRGRGTRLGIGLGSRSCY